MAPAKRKASKPTSGGSEDEDYRKKRDRNNQAVKRSRVKAKEKSSNTRDRVQLLQQDNERLRAKTEEKKKNLENLKNLFLATAKAKGEANPAPAVNYDLQKLLAASDDEGELE